MTNSPLGRYSETPLLTNVVLAQRVYLQRDRSPTQEVFGDADILMIPKYPGVVASFNVLSRVYGGYILAHFEPVDESDQWYLLRRK